MASADWKVEIVDSSGEADYTVAVIGDIVVDIDGATDGQVLTIQPDGTVAAETLPSGGLLIADSDGTLAANSDGRVATQKATKTYADGKVADAINDGTTGIAPSQNAVSDALALKAPLASPTFTGTVTLDAVSATGPVTLTGAAVDIKNNALVLRIGNGSLGTVIGYFDAGNNAVKIGATPTPGANTTNIGAGGVATLSITSTAVTAASGVGITAASFMSPAAQILTVGSTGGNNVLLQTNSTTRVTIGGTTGNLTFAALNFSFDTTTGTRIGTATNEKIAFHNSTPVIQRAGAAQAAVATTAATNITPYGYSQAQADGIITLLNEIRATLVEKGLMKGAA